MADGGGKEVVGCEGLEDGEGVEEDLRGGCHGVGREDWEDGLCGLWWLMRLKDSFFLIMFIFATLTSILVATIEYQEGSIHSDELQ